MLGERRVEKINRTCNFKCKLHQSKARQNIIVFFIRERTELVAHEMIIDFRSFKQYGVEVADIAKRLNGLWVSCSYSIISGS